MKNYEIICGYKDLQVIGLDNRCPLYSPLDDKCNGHEKCGFNYSLKDMRRGCREEVK